MTADSSSPAAPDAPPPGDGDVLWEQWEEVDRLLEQVLDLGAAERQAFLERACPDNPELVRTVLSLAQVSAAEEDEPMSPGPGVLHAALADGPGPPPDDPDALVGSNVGAYRLTAVLGAGGMGSVYLAERADEEFERTVAVKVLRRSVNTPEVAARFKLERQILASLNHPAIAQMVDGGVMDDGRPFLVMEFVEGERIDEYANERRLGVDDRIRLTLGVAEAVEHAHRHMVVHRDLKPSNILVREDGSVKLLDFGIAKLLDEPGGAAEATETRGRFLTPKYAAPEQLLGEPASTQTDVYSLAALLYELLTGVRPYASGSGGTMLEQVVRGGEPTAPSAVLPGVEAADAAAPGTASLETARVSAIMGLSRSALRRRLSGDLDAILTRALRARPSERYASIEALREDLERHLAGHAVSARGDVLSYRVRKLAWRHRGAVAALSGAFLLASGSAIGLAVQRGNLIDATALASQEAETARQTAAFLTGLFEGSDPTERLGDTLTARALLERGVERLDRELTGQPAVRAELLGVLGTVHMNLGSHEEGMALRRRAAELIRDSVPGQEGLARALSSLALTHANENEYELSRDTYRAAIEIAAADGDSVELGWARIGLGRALSFLEQPDSAEVELRAGLDFLPAIESRSSKRLSPSGCWPASYDARVISRAPPLSTPRLSSGAAKLAKGIRSTLAGPSTISRWCGGYRAGMARRYHSTVRPWTRSRSCSVQLTPGRCWSPGIWQPPLSETTAWMRPSQCTVRPCRPPGKSGQKAIGGRRMCSCSSARR